MGSLEVKEFIVKYIERKISPDDLWTMSRKRIVEETYNRFKSKEYSKKEIEQILEEVLLEEKKNLIEDEVSFNIIYPRKRKGDVKKYWEGNALLSFPNKTTILIISFVSLLVSVFIVKPDYFIAFLMIPLSLLIVYFALETTIQGIQKSFGILKKDKISSLIYSRFVGSSYRIINFEQND